MLNQTLLSVFTKLFHQKKALPVKITFTLKEKVPLLIQKSNFLGIYIIKVAI